MEHAWSCDAALALKLIVWGIFACADDNDDDDDDGLAQGFPNFFSSRPKSDVWCLSGTQAFKNTS